MNPKHNKSNKYPQKSPKGKNKKRLERASGSTSSRESNKPMEEIENHSSDEDLDAYLESPYKEESSDVEYPPEENPVAVAEGAAGASGEACVPSPILRSALLGKRITPTDGAKGSPNAQVPSQCHGSPNIAGASVPIPSMQAAANIAQNVSGSVEDPSLPRTRASPKRKQSLPGAMEGAVPLTSPSKIPKIGHAGFGDAPSEFFAGASQGEASTSGTRQVKFLQNTLSLTSSSSDDTYRNAPRSDSTVEQFQMVGQQNTPKLQRTSSDDRYHYFGSNVAEKLRLVNDVYQQFLAESLIHVVLSEALVGNLNKAHKVVGQCKSEEE